VSRGLWFAAGAGAGVYAAKRARRALDSLTAEGLRQRWDGLTHAARLAGEELRTARTDKEAELRGRLGLDPPAAPALPPAALPPTEAGPPSTDDTRDTA
jgi:hypothetical protein